MTVLKRADSSKGQTSANQGAVSLKPTNQVKPVVKGDSAPAGAEAGEFVTPKTEKRDGRKKSLEVKPASMALLSLGMLGLTAILLHRLWR